MAHICSKALGSMTSMNEDSSYASAFGKNLFCFVWLLLLLSLSPPITLLFTLQSKDSAHKNVVVHIKIIEFVHSVVTHLVVALTSLWEEFGGYSAQVVGTGVTL